MATHEPGTSRPDSQSTLKEWDVISRGSADGSSRNVSGNSMDAQRVKEERQLVALANSANQMSLSSSPKGMKTETNQKQSTTQSRSRAQSSAQSSEPGSYVGGILPPPSTPHTMPVVDEHVAIEDDHSLTLSTLMRKTTLLRAASAVTGDASGEVHKSNEEQMDDSGASMADRTPMSRSHSRTFTAEEWKELHQKFEETRTKEEILENKEALAFGPSPACKVASDIEKPLPFKPRSTQGLVASAQQNISSNGFKPHGDMSTPSSTRPGQGKPGRSASEPSSDRTGHIPCRPILKGKTTTSYSNVHIPGQFVGVRKVSTSIEGDKKSENKPSIFDAENGQAAKTGRSEEVAANMNNQNEQDKQGRDTLTFGTWGADSITSIQSQGSEHIPRSMRQGTILGGERPRLATGEWIIFVHMQDSTYSNTLGSSSDSDGGVSVHIDQNSQNPHPRQAQLTTANLKLVPESEAPPRAISNTSVIDGAIEKTMDP